MGAAVLAQTPVNQPQFITDQFGPEPMPMKPQEDSPSPSSASLNADRVTSANLLRSSSRGDTLTDACFEAIFNSDDAFKLCKFKLFVCIRLIFYAILQSRNLINMKTGPLSFSRSKTANTRYLCIWKPHRMRLLLSSARSTKCNRRLRQLAARIILI